MQKLIFFLLISVVLLSNSCISGAIADAQNEQHMSDRTFTAEEMKKLKSTKTVFFIRENDKKLRDEFEVNIKDAWTLTPIELAPYSEADNYLKREGYSYFFIEGRSTTSKYGTNTHIYLTLKIPAYEYDKKGRVSKDNSIHYCRIELYPAFETVSVLMKSKPDEALRKLYTDSDIRNWSPAVLGLYLKDVQKQLEKSKREYLFASVSNEKMLAKLKKDTLYIPDYCLIKFGKFTGDESKRVEAKELMEDYKYKYKIVTVQELNDRLNHDELETHVLDYVKSSTEKLVRVYSSKSGKIYQRYRPISYNLKSGDLGDIFDK